VENRSIYNTASKQKRTSPVADCTTPSPAVIDPYIEDYIARARLKPGGLEA
jgi:hypothetical protein